MAQQQAPKEKKDFQMGVGARGPWARLSGGTPGQNQGGTAVFFFPHKDGNLLSVSAATWTKQGATQTPLRGTVKKDSIKYENGVVKFYIWVQMKISQNGAMEFSKNVLEAQGNSQEAPAEEEIPSE